MRTTVNISEQIYRQAKARAAQTAQSVSQVIEDALREALRDRPAPAGGPKPLPVFGGSGVLPGIDLADPSALRDRMDEGESLHALR